MKLLVQKYCISGDRDKLKLANLVTCLLNIITNDIEISLNL